MKRLLTAGAVIGLALALAACGGDTYVKVQGTTTISKGKELQDLQAALNAGAISQREYDDLRGRILKRPN